MCVPTNAGKLVIRCTVNFGGQITGLYDTAPPSLAFQLKEEMHFLCLLKLSLLFLSRIDLIILL